MSEIMMAMSKMAVEWENLKKADVARHGLVEQLFNELKDVMEANQKLQDKVERFEFNESNYLREVRTLQQDKTMLEERSDKAPFVLVLVDGDNTLFNDAYVKAGNEGGHLAAQALNRALETYLNQKIGSRAHRITVVRFYLNLTGLTKTYVNAGIIPDNNTLLDFVVGFNSTFPLFEFVDVGSDKEAADNKIKETLALYWPNGHCKHIMLAGSADRGYVSFLRQYSGRDESRTRLTLVESVPFPPDFRRLAADFQTGSFPEVFRNTKIVFTNRPNLRASDSPSTYASAIAFTPSVRGPTQASGAAAESTSPTTAMSMQRPIKCNRHGQRVDEPIPWCDKDTLENLKHEGHCKRFYLSNCTTIPCGDRHDARLSPGEKRALLRLARYSKCPNGLGCDDRDCVESHSCIYGEDCSFGARCKYALEEHNIDNTVAVTI